MIRFKNKEERDNKFVELWYDKTFESPIDVLKWLNNNDFKTDDSTERQAFVEDSKIKIYEIYQKGVKVGFFFDKKLADDVTKYLNDYTLHF